MVYVLTIIILKYSMFGLNDNGGVEVSSPNENRIPFSCHCYFKTGPINIIIVCILIICLLIRVPLCVSHKFH